MQLPATLGDLAHAAEMIDASTACADLDQSFRSRRRLASVAVVDGPRLGLIMRDAFGQLMSGPFGYGRTLWGRRPVSEVTDWTPVRVSAGATVVEVAQRLRSRPVENRHDDVLVDLADGMVGQVSAADLFDGLSRQFSYRAIHDDLTDLFNRSHFLDLLAEQCGLDQTERVLVAVIDLDGMKRINDSQGHLAGDAVLVRAAHHLRAAARPGEAVARLGGDEFVVLGRVARDRSADTAATELGDRCRLAIGAPDGSYAGQLVRASVGVAAAGDRANATTLLSEADMAMYQAKQAGGDQLRVTIDVESALAGNVDLVDRSVVQAVEGDELQVWYQPVVRIADQATVGFEALVRWAHPTMGLLTPDRFLPGAQRAGHTAALDAWVLARACADFATLLGKLGSASPQALAVNLAPATLATNFDELVEAALDSAGLSADRLVLELPEDADLDALTTARPRLERLRQLGVALVLDDMGTGSTSLRHLSTLTIAGLKIDAAFVAGMIANPRDHTVVKLLADLGRGLGMSVTAEGVENGDQLAALAELGVDNAQGYLLGRPHPFDMVVRSLDNSVHARSG
jgi:diguanylate cyclase (GGDEF)-like protein